MNDFFEALRFTVETARTREDLRRLARDHVLWLKPDVGSKIQAIIDELHRRFVYAPDPTEEHFNVVPFEPGSVVDIDDACAFVATIASLVGIRCRFVMAVYRERCWTLRVAYEEDGFWTVVDVLRQPWSDHLRFEQLIIGPEIEKEKP